MFSFLVVEVVKRKNANQIKFRTISPALIVKRAAWLARTQNCGAIDRTLVSSLLFSPSSLGMLPGIRVVVESSY